MLSTTTLNAGRWFHRSGFAVLLASSWACSTDTPTSPSPSPAAPVPGNPSPIPTSPSAPGAVKLALSRADVVFNTRAGNTLADSAVVSVTASSGAALDELTAIVTSPAGSSDSWLTASLDQTTLPAQLTLRARAGALQPGEYTAMVKLRAPGAEAESLLVTTRVLSGAGIGLNAAKICFTMTLGDNEPNPDDVRITSVDGSPIEQLTATVMYDPGQPTGWLSTRLDPTTAPTRLWLDPNLGPMPAATYSATVLVASPQAGNSPVPIRVTLTINPFDPAKASRLNVHIEWEGPQNGGLATIMGNSGIFCQSTLDGTPPGPNCGAILADGIGDIAVSYDQDWGAQFLRWTGACTAEGVSAPCTVHFSTPGTTQEVTAVYGTMPSTISNILLQGAGASGTVTFSAPVTATGSGRALVCRLVNGVPDQACNGVVEAGVGTFTVTATPDAGSVFVWWAVGGLPGLREFPPVRCVETAPSCSFTFTHGGGFFDGIVTFASTSSLSLQVEVQGAGRVVWPYSPERGYSVTCSGEGFSVCEEYLEPGSTVMFTAYPDPGATFLGWTDCTAPSGATCDMLMTENRHVIARFSE